MEQLVKQVQRDLIYTFVWAAVAIAIAGTLYYLVW